MRRSFCTLAAKCRGKAVAGQGRWPPLQPEGCMVAPPGGAFQGAADDEKHFAETPVRLLLLLAYGLILAAVLLAKHVGHGSVLVLAFPLGKRSALQQVEGTEWLPLACWRSPWLCLAEVQQVAKSDAP